MRLIKLLGLFAVIALLLSMSVVPMAVAQEDEWGEVVVAPGDTVKIGFAAGLSGAGIDVLGIDEQRGAELAVKDRPEVLGFEVELLVEDSQCNAEGGQTVANKFVANPDVTAVVGHMCSSACTPASKIYLDNHYTMVSPSCTAPSLTAADTGTPIFNRVCWNDKIQGPAAGRFAREVLGVSKAATIHDGSPYAEQLGAEFAKGFEELGGEIVAREAVNVGDTDMRPVLTRIKAGEPALIYWSGFVAEGGYLATQRADVGMEGVIFMGADGIKAEEFIKAAGDAAEGVYASAANPAEAGPGMAKFLEDYKAIYGEDPIAPFHAHAYDGAMVIMNAIEQVGQIDGEGNLLIGRKALSDAIRGTEGLQGLTGVITCDEYGDCGTGTVAVSVVENGAWVLAPMAPSAEEDPWGMVKVTPGDTVKIGFAAGLSGAGIDVLGIDEQRGAELAVKDRPEVLGFEVELLVEDSQCNAEGGQTVANKFVANPDVTAVVGHMCSSACTPASKIYLDNHYTMVSPSCTAPSLTAADTGTPIFNRVCWNDKIQGPAAGRFAREVLGVSKAATIHDGSPYAEQLGAEFAKGFEELGGEIVAREAVNVGDTDMRPVLTRIKAGEPALIYWSGFVAEGGYLATQRADVGMEGVIFMGADGIKAEEFIKAAGDAAEGVYASAANPAEAGPGMAKFLEDYKAIYGEDPIAPFHAHAYDGAMVIMNAIEQVGQIDGEGNLLIGRKALSDAIRGTEGLQGLTGVITCDEYGDCGTGTVAVSVVKDGAWTLAEQ